jgi:hypothetical protein
MVNATVPGDQFAPDVAMDATGNFVVTWVSAPSTGSVFVPPAPPQDGDGAGVFARTFAYNPATGLLTPGAEFQVNQTTAGDQTLPAIAMSDSGQMAIAWQSWNQYPDSGWDVLSRRYSVTFP